jgi:hypothetical protein
LKGFAISLVLGDVQSGSSEVLTPGAEKALADMKGFLPYKTYRTLDTAYQIGLNGPHLQLKGVDGQKHEFFMRSTVVSPTVIKVDLLRLWDVPGVDSRNSSSGPNVLIDTSFKLDLGETVVVGTSRLDGGRALLVVLTAVEDKKR